MGVHGKSSLSRPNHYGTSLRGQSIQREPTFLQRFKRKGKRYTPIGDETSLGLIMHEVLLEFHSAYWPGHTPFSAHCVKSATGDTPRFALFYYLTIESGCVGTTRLLSHRPTAS